MTTDVDAADLDPRCPSCSARVPGSAQWCTLCFADLRPAPEPQPAPRPPQQPQPQLEPLTSPTAGAARGTALALDPALVAGMLAELAVQQPRGRVLSLAVLVGTPARKVLVAGLGVLAVAGLILLVSLVAAVAS